MPIGGSRRSEHILPTTVGGACIEWVKIAHSFAYLLIKVPLNFVWSNLNTFGSTEQNIINFHPLELSEIVILGLNTNF